MSVRKHEEALEPHLDKILEGIDGFSDAVRERIKSGGWLTSHIGDISALRTQLQALVPRLEEVRQENW